MNVNSVTNNQPKTDTTSRIRRRPTVDYNAFLQLLIAQMKNQDPTSPTDMSQYMSQFAQMSSVEQAIQTNTKLDTLLSSTALSQAESLIGRTASVYQLGRPKHDRQDHGRAHHSGRRRGDAGRWHPGTAWPGHHHQLSHERTRCARHRPRRRSGQLSSSRGRRSAPRCSSASSLRCCRR